VKSSLSEALWWAERGVTFRLGGGPSLAWKVLVGWAARGDMRFTVWAREEDKNGYLQCDKGQRMIQKDWGRE